MSNADGLYADKQLIHRVSEGIKSKKVSDADLISFSNNLIASAKKRKSSNPNIERPIKLSSFAKLNFDHRKGGGYAENIENDSNSLGAYATQDISSSNSSDRNSFETYTSDNYDHLSQEDYNSSDYNNEVDAAEPTSTSTALPNQHIISTSTSAADQIVLLKERVGKAVVYQLLHILNHGSLVEVIIIILS